MTVPNFVRFAGGKRREKKILHIVASWPEKAIATTYCQHQIFRDKDYVFETRPPGTRLCARCEKRFKHVWHASPDSLVMLRPDGSAPDMSGSAPEGEP